MRSSQFLAIAAIACLFAAVQSQSQSGACTDASGINATQCAICQWNVVNETNNTQYSCKTAMPGYYLPLPNATTGQQLPIACPADFTDCTLYGNNYLYGTSKNSAYWTQPACGVSNVNATSFYTPCNGQTGASTCNAATGEIITCLANYYFFPSINTVFTSQRAKCVALTPTQATIDAGGDTISVQKGFYCVYVAKGQLLNCYACPTGNGSVCAAANFKPVTNAGASLVQVSSNIQCGVDTYPLLNQATQQVSCSACATNGICTYGKLVCNSGYYISGSSSLYSQACTACPTGDGIQFCDAQLGFQCCQGYYKSYDKTSCKTCPTSDVWGVWTEDNVASCSPAGKGCAAGYTNYKDTCYPSWYAYTLSSSVLAYTSMMIVAIVLALF